MSIQPCCGTRACLPVEEQLEVLLPATLDLSRAKDVRSPSDLDFLGRSFVESDGMRTLPSMLHVFFSTAIENKQTGIWGKYVLFSIGLFFTIEGFQHLKYPKTFLDCTDDDLITYRTELFLTAFNQKDYGLSLKIIKNGVIDLSRMRKSVEEMIDQDLGELLSEVISQEQFPDHEVRWYYREALKWERPKCFAALVQSGLIPEAEFDLPWIQEMLSRCGLERFDGVRFRPSETEAWIDEALRNNDGHRLAHLLEQEYVEESRMASLFTQTLEQRKWRCFLAVIQTGKLAKELLSSRLQEIRSLLAPHQFTISDFGNVFYEGFNEMIEALHNQDKLPVLVKAFSKPISQFAQRHIVLNCFGWSRWVQIHLALEMGVLSQAIAKELLLAVMVRLDEGRDKDRTSLIELINALEQYIYY